MLRVVAISLLVGLCLNVGSARSQGLKQPKAGPIPKKAGGGAAALMRLLDQPIDTKGLQERVKLKQALEYFNDKLGGRMTILIDREAFIVEFGPDSPDPYEVEVSVPPINTKMPMVTALRLILSHVGEGQTIYVVRDEFIEITTLKATSSAHLLQVTSIYHTFENQGLKDVLRTLSDQGALDIHLDPSVGKKADTLISARFRHASLENALVVATEIAELKFVVLERSIFVTTPQKAEVLQREEKERAAHRKETKAKRLVPASE